MRRRTKLWPILVLLALLAACASPTPTPTPPGPTATPAPTPVLVTSAEQIAGTWVGTAADKMYQRFNLDGTWHVAVSLENLNDKPDAELTFRFEGTQLLVTEISATGLPSCAAKNAIYQVQLLSNGNIKFVRVQDACAPRARSTAQEHKRVP